MVTQYHNGKRNVSIKLDGEVKSRGSLLAFLLANDMPVDFIFKLQGGWYYRTFLGEIRYIGRALYHFTYRQAYELLKKEHDRYMKVVNFIKKNPDVRHPLVSYVKMLELLCVVNMKHPEIWLKELDELDKKLQDEKKATDKNSPTKS